jgi:hypothetical protein
MSDLSLFGRKCSVSRAARYLRLDRGQRPMSAATRNALVRLHNAPEAVVASAAEKTRHRRKRRSEHYRQLILMATGPRSAHFKF